MRIRDYIRRWRAKHHSRPWVRPWALLAPITLILISLLMLRPLRYPAKAAPDESIRLETIQSIGERRSFAIARVDHRNQGSWQEGTVTLYRVGPSVYSGQPPMMASLLGTAYWVMNRWGLSMRDDPVLVVYLLTLLGTTIPAAAAAGLIYRMARMFELPRTWRSALSFAAVMGSGLGSYAVVLNSHVPAATLVLGAGAAIIHWARSERPFKSLGWLSVAGMCAATAAALDPMSVVFLVLFTAPIFTLRVGFPTRLAGVLLYIAGAMIPLVAHSSIALRIGTPVIPRPFVDAPIIQHVADPAADDDTSDQPSLFEWKLLRISELSLGVHGTLIHFPLLALGILGIAAVMHRHWPLWLKSLAAATGTGACVVFCIVAFSNANLQYAMFASRWFLCFSPLLVLWIGAWLKRSHSKGVRVLAITCLIFSLLSGFIGLLHPWPSEGYGSFTIVDVFSRLAD